MTRRERDGRRRPQLDGDQSEFAEARSPHDCLDIKHKFVKRLAEHAVRESATTRVEPDQCVVSGELAE